MLNSPYSSAIITAAATLLLGVAGGIGFVGGHRDATTLQTKFMRKDTKLDKEQAAEKANRSLDRWKRGCFIAWMLGVVAAIIAVVLAVTAGPAAPPHQNKVKTIQECCGRNIDHTLVSKVQLSSFEEPRPTPAVGS